MTKKETIAYFLLSVFCAVECLCFTTCILDVLVGFASMSMSIFCIVYYKIFHT